MRKSRKEYTSDIWESYFEMAKLFYEQNNHLLIPHDYIYQGKRLGRWIGTQRQNYQKQNNPFFTEERIKRLESIGMSWNVKEDNWEKFYTELEKYKKKFGNVRVPQSYITENGILLGSWVNLQRMNYKKHRISNYKKEKLESLEMIWRPKELVKNNWDTNFGLLQKYIKKHKVLPKVDYVTDTGIKLGAWLGVQRSRHNKGILSLERTVKLEKLGALLDVSKDNWEKRFQQAKDFYNTNGNLYFKGCKMIYDKGLGAWLSRQRVLHAKGKLSSTQIQKLESIGMMWDLYKEHWDYMYERAKEFYIAHGHLHISKNPRTSDDYKLGLWLDEQRKNYRIHKNIDEKQIQRLEAIGMMWNLYKSPEEIWNNWYHKAKKFYEENHHLNPPKGKLRTWVYAQKAAKKGLRGSLTKQQIELLEQIGIVWDVKKDNWNKMYGYAKNYYQIHEILNIPINYITEDGYKLGIWIARQRNIYKDIIKNNKTPNEIMKKRISLLNQIDMIWDASKLTTKTSFQEKAIFYYLSQVYDDVQKISQWEFIGYEMDIYIPSIKTAIEYDGIWHKNTLDNDNRKNKACKDNGITLIRLREAGLPKVSCCPFIIEVSDNNDEAFELAINKLFSLLNIKGEFVNINKDRSKILRTYRDYTAHVWDSNYEKLYLYHKNNGYIFPITKYSKIDKHLRYWINGQRDDYKNGLLTPLQIKKLEKIGFDFGPNEAKWQRMYKLAVDYYNKYNNLQIPYNYATSEGNCLGLWLYKQKRLYRRKEIDLNHVKLLEKLGIDWRLKAIYRKESNITKNIYFKELKSYYMKHGNIDITLNYVSDNGLKLGKWLARRRSDYKKNKLNDDVVNLLNKFKIKWNVIDERWEDMFEVAKEYYLKHGNILISANYVTDDGIHLGDWISRQRQKYYKTRNNKPLTDVEINKLNSINMIWDPYSEKWLKNYMLAKNFFDKFHHLNIPVNYITEDGVKLGMWISSQRQANRGNPNYLMTPERKRLLDDINMNWELRCTKPNARKRRLY